MEAVAGPGIAEDLPLGLIFSAFMCCMMLGSLMYSAAVKADPGAAIMSPVLRHARLAVLTFGLASASLGVVGLSSRVEPVFWAFCAFEFTVGSYFPTFGWLKGELVADEVRANVGDLLLLLLVRGVKMLISTFYNAVCFTLSTTFQPAGHALAFSRHRETAKCRVCVRYRVTRACESGDGRPLIAPCAKLANSRWRQRQFVVKNTARMAVPAAGEPLAGKAADDLEEA